MAHKDNSMNAILETKPIAERILLKLEKSPTNKLGLATPDKERSLLQVGTVVQIGKGKFGRTGKRREMEVKIGDRIVIKKFAGVDIKLDGEEYLMMGYQDVEAIVE